MRNFALLIIAGLCTLKCVETQDLPEIKETTETSEHPTKTDVTTTSNEPNSTDTPPKHPWGGTHNYGSQWGNRNGGFGIGGQRVNWGGLSVPNKQRQPDSGTEDDGFNLGSGVSLGGANPPKPPTPSEIGGTPINSSGNSSSVQISGAPNIPAQGSGGGIGGQPVPSNTEPTTEQSWQVAIFDLEYFRGHYNNRLICAGSLVTPTTVISAAHCFWDDDGGWGYSGLKSFKFYSVVAGAQHTDSEDPNVQIAGISDVLVPPRFRGRTTNFQDDIAVVKLDTAISRPGVKPICVNFDIQFDRQQLKSGNPGTVLGWGLSSGVPGANSSLRTLYLPYVEINECIDTIEKMFLKYISSDKICAKVETGYMFCNGDNGAGVAYFAGKQPVPYLRGVMSTTPEMGCVCKAYKFATITHLLEHKEFLLQHIPDLEDECRNNYPNADEIVDRPRDIPSIDNKISDDKNEKTTNFACNCYCNK